jgi:DNA-binding NtrC family response regulator
MRFVTNLLLCREVTRVTMRAGPTNVLFIEAGRLESSLLRVDLERRGARVHLADTSAHAVASLQSDAIDAAIVFAVGDDRAASDNVRRIRARDPSLCVIAVVDPSADALAVSCFRSGASDVLERPAAGDAILACIARALVARDRSKPAVRVPSGGGIDLIVGAHPALDRVRAFASRISTVPNVRVLITGESGTGKSLLARAIHDLSETSGEFVEINCAALPAHLLESELFGHEKGAFTDARQMKRGLLEMAHRGTLLLDEIGALPLELQAKLLLFLERQTFRRVGGISAMRAETRVIAATNEDLKARVQARQFRMDLLYRIDVTSVQMPALRSMADVIPELALHFMGEICTAMRKQPPVITDETNARLKAHSWPGNGRELRNAVERALIFHQDGPLGVDPPPADALDPAVRGAIPLNLTLEEAEARYIALVLEANADVELNEIARRLGISRKTLWKRRRRYGL